MPPKLTHMPDQFDIVSQPSLADKGKYNIHPNEDVPRRIIFIFKCAAEERAGTDRQANVQIMAGGG